MTAGTYYIKGTRPASGFYDIQPVVVTVNPSTGATTFTAGATTICQDAADEKYRATAENSTSTTYAVSPESAGVIDAATGVMNWDATFSGTATITATSTGLCGTTTADLPVTVNPATGAVLFIAGATTVCHDAADETYGVASENSTAITYSVSPASAGTIDTEKGVMNWDAAFSGTATITATATGLCGTTTADLAVSVDQVVGATTFMAGATMICQDAADEKIHGNGREQHINHLCRLTRICGHHRCGNRRHELGCNIQRNCYDHSNFNRFMRHNNSRSHGNSESVNRSNHLYNRGDHNLSGCCR